MSLSCVIPLMFGLFIFTTILRQSQATVTENQFSLLEEGDPIVGEMFQTTMTRSSLHCSARCAFDTMCFAYQYTEQNNLNCRIIRRNSVAGQNFVLNETKIYLKACRELWTPPNSWTTGDQPTVYRSFDKENYCFELINGAGIVPGKVSNAVKTNSTFQQWISLGDLSLVTCLPKPWTCGPEGASLTVWINIDDCSGKSGIMSSMAHPSNGFSAHCQSDKIRYSIRVSDGYFHFNNGQLNTDWYHLAMIFHGSNEGQGFSVYHDGSLIKWDSTKVLRNHTENSGNVIIGKRFTDRDEDYGSVMVDELTFWDRELLPEEIQAIAAM